MTDKQIIIDGIDVSECKYFNKYQRIVRNNECIVDMQNACIEEIKTKPCSQKHNCYFKNWQRKEQECERLKKQLMQKSEVDMFFNTPIEGWSNDPCGICRYKQTLEEIREIAQIACEKSVCDRKHCDYCSDGRIIQKIKEVINE